MRVFLLFALMTVFFAAPAHAQGEVIACGVPVSEDTSTVATGPSQDFCDMYTRQLAYPAEFKKLHNQLVERQKAFAVPRDQARQAYLKNLEAYHNSIGSNNAGND